MLSRRSFVELGKGPLGALAKMAGLMDVIPRKKSKAARQKVRKGKRRKTILKTHAASRLI
jgi:hypothetical protein